MIRLLALVLAGAMIFLGFGLPFFVGGNIGLILAGGTVLTGAVILGLVEAHTAASLNRKTAWNRFLKSGGDFVVDQPPQRNKKENDDQAGTP